MDSELALKYLEEFDKQTKGKNEFPRVLMVDGHASHCSLTFLDRAAGLGIYVVSYPPHTTHALQGLDVIIFAVLKHNWKMLRDARERGAGLPLKKEDFLVMYHAARIPTLTPANIIEAFRKTGAHPINRDAISAEMMVPSEETTNQVIFPAYLSSPVKAILAAHHAETSPAPAIVISAPDGTSSVSISTATTADTNIPASADPSLYSPTKRAKVMNFLLEKTSASFLLNKEPALTTDPTKNTIPPPIFETPPTDALPEWALLQHPIPTSADDKHAFAMALLTHLGRSKAYSATLQSCLEASHAQLVLAHLEISRLQSAVTELKTHGKKKNSRAKLMSSSIARLLTSEEFRDALRQGDEEAAAKLAARAVKNQKKRLGAQKKAWRRADIDARKALRDLQVAQWEKDCKRAKRRKEKMPAKPSPPVRPQTPDDAYFLEKDGEESEDEQEDVEEEEEEE